MDVVKFYVVTLTVVDVKGTYYQFQIIEKVYTNGRTQCGAMDASKTRIKKATEPE